MAKKNEAELGDFDYDRPGYFEGASDEVRKEAIEVAALQVRNTRERIGVKHMDSETIAAFRAALELNHQLPNDLCGDQREFALPRVRELAKFFMTRFPHHMFAAMAEAVDGYGDKINPTGDQP